MSMRLAPQSKSNGTAAADPEQLLLVGDPDLWRAVDVPELKKQSASLRKRRRADATLKAYESDWRHFRDWCATAGRPALPASEETIELYLTHFSALHKLSTLQRRVSGISQAHQAAGLESPAGPGARAILEGVARARGARPTQKAALTPAQLADICRQIDANTAKGARDRALLVLGFATGLRRSELAALQVSDVEFVEQGIIVEVRKSKTDQKAQGRAMGIFPGAREETCPVRTLRIWLELRHSIAGALFTRLDDAAAPGQGITGGQVAEILKAAVERIGLDPANYSGHSLRAGMITAASSAGVPDSAIMRRSGHKSIATLQRYMRSTDLFALDPLAGAV